MAPFVEHTSFLCLSFGALFSLINPFVDAVFDARLSTVEAQAMVRHFGLAMLFVGLLCRTFSDQALKEFTLLVAEGIDGP